MALSITHSTVVAVADDGTSPVGSDEWNDDHAITGTVGPDEGARELLTAARTYYVRTDGSDSNTGLVDSAGGAFLTWQHAYDLVCSTLDLGGNTVTIAHGNEGGGVFNFAEAVLLAGPWTGGGSIVFTGSAGDLTTPSNLVITDVAASNGVFTNTCTLPGSVTIQGMKLVSPNGYGSINNWGVGTVNFDKIDFGAASFAQLYAGAPGAQIILTGSATYTISGSAYNHIYADPLCMVAMFSGPNVTLTGTPDFSGGFAAAYNLGNISVIAATYTGAATGPRYDVGSNAVINTFGGGANFFPGDSAGADDGFGAYF
jgi:hypothetical protein